MLEAYNSRYSFHPGSPNMHHDQGDLLVERHEKERRRLCGQLSELSASESRAVESLVFSSQDTYTFEWRW